MTFMYIYIYIHTSECYMAAFKTSTEKDGKSTAVITLLMLSMPILVKDRRFDSRDSLISLADNGTVPRSPLNCIEFEGTTTYKG